MIKSLKLNLGIILFIYLFFGGCGNNKSSHEQEHHEDIHSDEIILSQASINEIGLQTKSLSLRPLEKYITVPAQVWANQDNEAQVGSLVQGRVYKVFVKTGDYVKTGQDLMYVEGLEIGEIKAGFLSAKANLEYQRADFERQKALMEQQIGSQKSYLQAKAEYEKAQAEYNAHDMKIHSIGLTDDEVTDKKSIGNDKHTSGTLPVRSPINGIVVERNVAIGQFVDATTNAFKIINTSSVWIDGQIYEKDINKISEISEIVFTTPSFPDDKFTGKVFYVGQIIEEESRTISIRAEFKNLDGKLKPHMFGEMQLPVGNKSMAILIPAEALIKMGNLDYVFVQKDDSLFERRSVITGLEQNQLIEIREGLNEKDKVVVKGTFYLKSELMKDELEGDEH